MRVPSLVVASVYHRVTASGSFDLIAGRAQHYRDGRQHVSPETTSPVLDKGTITRTGSHRLWGWVSTGVTDFISAKVRRAADRHALQGRFLLLSFNRLWATFIDCLVFWMRRYSLLGFAVHLTVQARQRKEGP